MIDVLGLLGDGDIDAHSAVSLTYNLDLCFYDHYVRRTLRNARVDNQIVFCDASQYQLSLAELSHAPRCGREYSLTPVRAPGAFHPKLYLLVGAREGRLVVGSGNLSVGGLMRNAELFGVFDYHDSDGGPHPAFVETVAFIRELAGASSDAVRDQVDRATSASWLRLPPVSDGRILLFGGGGRPPLLQRVAASLRERTIRNLTICSASFDKSLTALKRLVKLTEGGSLTCIVQPENVRLDGSAVRRLGDSVEWRPFLDPYPPEKKKKKKKKKIRRDVRSHEKLFVFDCGDEELVVFGSANASAPALIEVNENVETLVVLPWQPVGSTVEHLGLGPSIDAASVFDALTQKAWDDDGDDDDVQDYDFDLISALVDGDRIALTLAQPIPTDRLHELELELCESPGRPHAARWGLRSGIRGPEVGGVEVLPPSRCCRLVGPRDAVRSNYVALTWVDVQHLGRGHNLSARYSSALAAMLDGKVLGTVLFELLDRFRDFEVVFARERGESAADDADATADDNRPSTAFYTDAVQGRDDPERWLGDRADLDLVAALIQPLSATKTSRREDLPDADVADILLAEEQERREIDAKKGSATGGERPPEGVASAVSIERAAARLERRLNRAASAAEGALAAKARKRLKEIALPHLARQVWMAHLTAFFAGRIVTSSDQQDVTCLEESAFAAYVLRVCHALAGGKAGGLLSLLPDSSWQATDGDHVKRGLAFVETCCLWAVSWVRNYWNECEDPELAADGLWDSIPELIGARFLNALHGRVKEPDLDDLDRRLPQAREVGADALLACRVELLKIAAALRDADAGTASTGAAPKAWKPGHLVFNRHLGITFVAGVVERNVHLLDLSKGEDCRRTYRAEVVSAVADERLRSLKWREIYEE